MPTQSNIISVSKVAEPIPFLSEEKILFSSRPHGAIVSFFISTIIISGALIYYFLFTLCLKTFITGAQYREALSIFILAVFLVCFIIFLYWRTTHFILTNVRVELRFGIIAQGTISISLKNIENISSNISLLGTIFNFGTIKIEPAGISKSVIFSNIPSPNAKKELIEQSITNFG